MPFHIKSSRGSALAEVMLAFSLLLITLVVIASVFPYAYRADQKAWRKSTGQSLANSTLEALRGTDFDDVADSDQVVNVEQTPYRVVVTVTDSTAAPVKSKNVICEVSWGSADHRSIHRQETRLARLQRGN